MHTNDFVNAKSHTREKPLLAGYAEVNASYGNNNNNDDKNKSGGKRRGLGPRNDVLTTCKAVTLHGGQRIIEVFFPH